MLREPAGEVGTVVLVSLLGLAVGCYPIGSPDPSYPGPGDSFAGRRDLREGLSRKKVADKVEHTLLVAVDRSECQVSPERWKKIEIGDAVWCYWRVERPPRLYPSVPDVAIMTDGGRSARPTRRTRKWMNGYMISCA